MGSAAEADENRGFVVSHRRKRATPARQEDSVGRLFLYPKRSSLVLARRV